MIPSFIFLMVRKYRRANPEKFQTIMAYFKKAAQIAILVAIATFAAIYSYGQSKVLNYSIQRNGSEIGKLRVKESKQGGRTTYQIQSEVKVSFVLTFRASQIEEAIYENGVLLYSYIYRKMNGSEKANQKTHLESNKYRIRKKDEEESFQHLIRYSMSCIFTQEPVEKQVYSDYFRQMISIDKKGAHEYRIRFPDGNYNDYYYKDGVCVKIKVHNTLSTAIIELKS